MTPKPRPRLRVAAHLAALAAWAEALAAAPPAVLWAFKTEALKPGRPAPVVRGEKMAAAAIYIQRHAAERGPRQRHLGVDEWRTARAEAWRRFSRDAVPTEKQSEALGRRLARSVPKGALLAADLLRARPDMPLDPAIEALRPTLVIVARALGALEDLKGGRRGESIERVLASLPMDQRNMGPK